MELIYIAFTVKILGMTDPNGLPAVDVYPMRFTTKQECEDWRMSRYRQGHDVIDHVSGAEIVAQFHECTPYQPKDIIADIEAFREAN